MSQEAFNDCKKNLFLDRVEHFWSKYYAYILE